MRGVVVVAKPSRAAYSTYVCTIISSLRGVGCKQGVIFTPFEGAGDPICL